MFGQFNGRLIISRCISPPLPLFWLRNLSDEGASVRTKQIGIRGSCPHVISGVRSTGHHPKVSARFSFVLSRLSAHSTHIDFPRRFLTCRRGYQQHQLSRFPNSLRQATPSDDRNQHDQSCLEPIGPTKPLTPDLNVLHPHFRPLIRAS